MAETLLNNEVSMENCEATKYKTEDESVQTLVASENGKSTRPAVDEVATTSSVEETSTPLYDLNKFQLQRILNNNTRNKSISLLGSFPHVSDTDNAIVIFEKRAFQEGDVDTKNHELVKDEEDDASNNGTGDNGASSNGTEENGSSNNGTRENGASNDGTAENGAESEECTYFGNDLKVQTEFINNIYGSYQCTPPSKLSGVKATVIYPATDKHIEKYSTCQKYVINETPKFYKDITLPYITSSQFSLEWVYNILEHKQESERIIFEDPNPETGFILLPDLKWDGRNIENLYVLVITHKRDVKSLRDLNPSHLPLLRNIRSRATEEIEKRYGLVGTQLRMYFHYQPSFYHIHVHINPVRNDAPGIWCEKSHMLDTVINNLELLPDYYEKASLPFVVYEGNKLLDLYETKMPIRKTSAAKRLAVQLDDEGERIKGCDKMKKLPTVSCSLS